MNYQVIDLGLGCQLIQPYDESGYYCVICAKSHGDRCMYYSDGQPVHDFICPDCRMHPGFDDTPDEKDGLTQEQYVARYRRGWLDSVGWDEECVRRLRSVFEMSDDDIDTIRTA